MTKFNNRRLTNFNPRLTNKFYLIIKSIKITLIINENKNIIRNLTNPNNS